MKIDFPDASGSKLIICFMNKMNISTINNSLEIAIQTFKNIFENNSTHFKSRFKIDTFSIAPRTSRSKSKFISRKF